MSWFKSREPVKETNFWSDDMYYMIGGRKYEDYDKYKRVEGLSRRLGRQVDEVTQLVKQMRPCLTLDEYQAIEAKLKEVLR